MRQRLYQPRIPDVADRSHSRYGLTPTRPSLTLPIPPGVCTESHQRGGFTTRLGGHTMRLRRSQSMSEDVFWQRATRASIEALALPHGTTALDIGCGRSEATRHMAAAAGAAIGTGTNDKTIDAARKATGPEYDARFERATPQDLPFPDATFSGVRIDRSLQHVDDIGAVTEEIWRVATPGARIA